MDIDCQGDWEQEAGEMVINEADALGTPTIVLPYASRECVLFQACHGRTRTPSASHGKPSNISTPILLDLSPQPASRLAPDKRFCGHTMLQYDFDSRPLFVHANLVKLLPAEALPRSSETWAIVKRYIKDTDRAHARIAMWYHMGGICIDFLPEYDPKSWKTNGGNGAWWSDYRNKFGDGHGDPPKPGEPELEMLTFDEISGKEFEEAYWRHGGVGGGKGVFDGKIDADEARRKAKDRQDRQEAVAKAAKALANPDIESDEKLAADTENERDAWKAGEDTKHT